MKLHRHSNSLRRTPRNGWGGGFSLIEVVVSVALIVLVATTALASLRSGLRTLGGTEQAARAVDAIREYREFTYSSTVAEMDAIDGTTTTAVLADGTELPDSSDITLNVSVIPVDDNDPETQVDAGSSSTRLVTITAYAHGRKLQQASWLIVDI
jgi:type II secretory pathway pseudopilin PulG